MKFKKLLLVFMLLFMIVPVRAEETPNQKDTEEKIPAPFLKDIKINNVSIEGFSKDKYEYELHMDKTVEKVTISPEYDPEYGGYYKHTTEGSLYNHVLKPGKNVIKIIVSNKDDNENPVTYTLTLIKEDDRNSDATLSSLVVANQKIDLKEGVFEYTVQVDNKLKSVEITATKNNDKAEFVQGYGERTGNNSVPLNGEVTNVEVRVKAENETQKTYKITIKKSNYQSNDANLRSLTIKEVKFNFSSNKTAYDIEVSNDIEKINIEAIANDTKAKVNYNKEVSLKEGLNKITVSVIAEDGTEKDYRLNVTRKEKVALVEKIEIEGIDLEFKPEVYEYDVETTLTTLNFTVSLTNKEATYEVLNNENLKNGSTVSLVIKNKDEEITYKFNIVNEEETNIKDETEENKEEEPKEEIKEDLNEESFLKKNEMMIALLTFGVGLISMLFAILTKKKEQ